MGVAVPKLENYNIKVLSVLGNQAGDNFEKNHIKFLIIKKLLLLNYSMFCLINKFLNEKQILKEAYAEVIMMRFQKEDYYIDESLIDDIVKLVSLDTLMYYGMESVSIPFRDKCTKEFWKRVIEIENKVELNKKINLDKCCKYKIKHKGKGDKNDKY